MDEELMNLESVEDAILVDIEHIEVDIGATEDEIVDADAVEDEVVVAVEEAEIIEIEIEEGVGYVAGESGLHSTLPDRNNPNQHEIEAITGLREELDWIKSPRTIESNGINVAAYYKWANGAYDDHGYFVSIVHGDKIKLCDGADIFGVVVESAGFVGDQADVKRDNSYGLVVTSGLVDVRCELDVNVGDYIVSNSYGYAKKSASNYGYRVLGTETKAGTLYAVIALGVQADVTHELGIDLDATKEQVNVNYKNIIAAVNLANQAYQKAIEAEESNKTMSGQVSGALGTVDKLEGDVNNLGSQVAGAAQASAQAKAIAQSAATAAESMRNEAVAEANKALADTSELRKELTTKVGEIDAEIENALLELQETKEGFDATINDLRLSTEGQIADLKQETAENYATTQQLAAVRTEVSDAIAVVKQEASDTYATIESVAAFQKDTSEAITGFKQEVAEDYATQEMLAAYKNDTAEALSLYKTEVAENYATQEMMAQFETDTSKAFADYKQEVQNTYATQEMVTKFEIDASKALSDYKQEVGETYATNESLVNLKTETTDAIAASEEKATATYASKNDLTSFEGKTNIAMARIEQKADDNGAYIHSTVSNMDKYSVGPHSQAYGFTRKQAASVLKEGMIYVPTANDISETYAGEDGFPEYKRNFSIGYLYRWGEISDGYGWITVDKDYSEAKLNTSAPAVYFNFALVPDVADATNYGYWYTNADMLTGTAKNYEPRTLYKWTSYTTKNNDGTDKTVNRWIPVATLAGNSQNRAVSQIRQDANSIALDVTNVKGDLAGIKIWAGNDFAAIQDTVSWKKNNSEAITTTMQRASDSEAYIAQVASVKNADGTINAAASIVTAVNKDTSGVTITAKHVNLNGFISANQTFTIDESGYMIATGGKIADWNITSPLLYTSREEDGTISIGNSTKNYTHICSGMSSKHYSDTSTFYADTRKSLVSPTVNGQSFYSPVRFYAGAPQLSGESNQALYYSRFAVLEDGSLYANAAQITGTITGSTFMSNDGTSIYLGTSDLTGQTIGDDGNLALRLKVGSNFGVTSDGTLYAVNGVFAGRIVSSEGKIGGFNIGTIGLDQYDMAEMLYSNLTISHSTWYNLTDSSFFICPGGITSIQNKIADQTGVPWVMGIGTKFGITTDGTVHASNLVVSGGQVGSWSVGTVQSQNGLSWASSFDKTLWATTAKANEEGYYVLLRASSDSRDWAFGIKKEYRTTVDESTVWKTEDVFSIKHDGTLYATKADISGTLHAGTGSSLGNFSINSDGNLSLSTVENVSNFMDVTKTYNSNTYGTRLSTGEIYLSRTLSSGTTNSIIIDAAGNTFPQLSFRCGNNGGITFKQYNSTYMQVTGSSSNLIVYDCGFGVYNGGYHLGVTCQIKLNNSCYIRIDKGVITGVSPTEYPTGSYPHAADGTI